MYCKSCGSFVPNGMGRCPVCGTPVLPVAYYGVPATGVSSRQRLENVLAGIAFVLSILLIALVLVVGGFIPVGRADAQGQIEKTASSEAESDDEVEEASPAQGTATEAEGETPIVVIETEPVEVDVEVDGTVYTERQAAPVYTPAPRYESAPAEPVSYGTYIVYDSDTRWYSKGELTYLSTYDLYLARNEIFARHGRRFVRDDLQRYFDAQGWYYGYIAPDDFDCACLSGTELHNVEVMKEIEQERNSPYL